MVTGIDAVRPHQSRAARPKAAALAAALFAGGVAGFAAPPGAAQTFGLTDYSGQELFDRFCAACHGATGSGDGPVAAALNVAVPDLTRLAERHDGRFPAADVRDIVDGRALVVAHGPRTMPVWGYEFWVEEGGDIRAEADARELIDRLVRHIQSIQRPGSVRPESIPPESIQPGAAEPRAGGSRDQGGQAP